MHDLLLMHPDNLAAVWANLEESFAKPCDVGPHCPHCRRGVRLTIITDDRLPKLQERWEPPAEFMWAYDGTEHEWLTFFGLGGGMKPIHTPPEIYIARIQLAPDTIDDVVSMIAGLFSI